MAWSSAARCAPATTPPTRIFILLTALDTSVENVEQATEAGVDDFLTKPLQRTTIRMRLRVAERILGFTGEIGPPQELIPICSWCYNVRQDRGYWNASISTLPNARGHASLTVCVPNALKRSSQRWTGRGAATA
jgi:DNA-binding response OmpR family regulator